MPERFGRTITPIYNQVGSGFVHEGTGVLVKATSRFWLLSAAHTLSGTAEPRWILGQPNFRLRPAIWHGDPLDLAFLELTTPEVSALIECGQNFLPFDRIDASGSDIENGKMIVTGFPSKAVDVDGGELTANVRLTKLTSRFFTNAEMKVRNVDPALQLAGLFKNLADEKGPLKKMDMKGLSGGGIWHMRNDDDPRLVGIVNKFDQRQQTLIGTRIRPMILEMRKRLEVGS